MLKRKSAFQLGLLPAQLPEASARLLRTENRKNERRARADITLLLSVATITAAIISAAANSSSIAAIVATTVVNVVVQQQRKYPPPELKC